MKHEPENLTLANDEPPASRTDKGVGSVDWLAVLPGRSLYYKDEWTAIYHGDCREVLARGELPRASLVLTDPPYAIGLEYAQYQDSKMSLRQLARKCTELMRRAAPAVMLTPGLQNMWEYPVADWVMAWTYWPGQINCKWGFNAWQPVLCYGKDPYLAQRRGGRDDCIHAPGAGEKNGHPCPKPLAAWKKIMARGSVNERDIIIDPFMGSGTTLQAARELGRYAIGIELSEEYCEIAAKRQQQRMMSFG